MAAWVDVTQETGMPGSPYTLRNDRGDGHIAEVCQIGHVFSWGVWGPQYQTSTAHGESRTLGQAIADAETALARN